MQKARKSCRLIFLFYSCTHVWYIYTFRDPDSESALFFLFSLSSVSSRLVYVSPLENPWENSFYLAVIAVSLFYLWRIYISRTAVVPRRRLPDLRLRLSSSVLAPAKINLRYWENEEGKPRKEYNRGPTGNGWGVRRCEGLTAMRDSRGRPQATAYSVKTDAIYSAYILSLSPLSNSLYFYTSACCMLHDTVKDRGKTRQFYSSIYKLIFRRATIFCYRFADTTSTKKTYEIMTQPFQYSLDPKTRIWL